MHLHIGQAHGFSCMYTVCVHMYNDLYWYAVAGGEFRARVTGV